MLGRKHTGYIRHSTQRFELRYLNRIGLGTGFFARGDSDDSYRLAIVSESLDYVA